MSTDGAMQNFADDVEAFGTATAQAAADLEREHDALVAMWDDPASADYWGRWLALRNSLDLATDVAFQMSALVRKVHRTADSMGDVAGDRSAVPQRIRTILLPGGTPIGTPQSGTPPEIRGLKTVQEVQEAFSELREGGIPHTPTGYPGYGYDIPEGGGWVGYRESKKYGPTIDINIPGVPIEKLHGRGS